MYSEYLLAEDQMSKKAMSSLQQCVSILKRTKSNQTIIEVREAFADMAADELENLIDEAVASVRKERRRERKRHSKR